MALGTCGPRCLLGYGLLCAMRASELHLESGSITDAPQLSPLGQQ